jgi:hypothetical protein
VFKRAAVVRRIEGEGEGRSGEGEDPGERGRVSYKRGISLSEYGLTALRVHSTRRLSC